jgi:hypothetical protein
MRLLDLFRRVGTGSKGCYAPAYEMLLRDRRESVEALLEIGIGTLDPKAPSTMFGWADADYKPGASLRAWRDYFPRAQIFGVDIWAGTQFVEERIRTFLCNSTDPDATAKLDIPGLDVIIDDGSHASEDQLATLRNFFPKLKAGGFYFIEDIGSTEPLYRTPRLVEPIIGDSHWFAISDDDQKLSRWKMIVIRKRL